MELHLRPKKLTVTWPLPRSVAVDGNLITARFPYDLPRMIAAMVQQLVAA